MCLSDLNGRQLIQALAALGLIAVGLDTKAQVPAPPATTESSKSATTAGAPTSVQSPYFAVQNDSGIDHFPMKETKVTAKLNGVIASVHVHQHYRNEGNKPINAKYVFPGSTRAAMNGMSMTIGNRRIKAQIKEKEQAQQMFAAAKAAGQTASLLAQKRPNVFSMDVANIGAGAEVDVDMDYTEFLTSTDGEYEFVYPGVVGPRYGGDADRTDAPVTWISNPYLKAGDNSPVAFDIDVQMDSPIALRDLTSTTHKVLTKWSGAKSVSIGLDEPKQTAGNRDFILHYRLQGDAIVTGLTRFWANGESYFMLQAQPPQRVVGSELPPREYVFILDTSGSMSGFPLDTARNLIGKLLAGLRPQDRFNILFFAGGSSVLSPESLPATPENFLRAGEMLKKLEGGGATELLPALQQALSMAAPEGTSRSLVLMTDGYVSAEDTAFKLVDDNLGKDNLYTFGIGSSVNRFLIEGLAKVGHAEAFVVTSEADATREAERFRQYISAPVMTDIQVRGRGVEIYDTEPRTQPDLLARRPVLVLGKYRDARTGAAIELTGVTGTGRQQWSFPLADATRDGSLPILWARKRLEHLYVFPNASKDSRAEILSLGLKYSLLTSATSFIGVDETLPTGDVEPATDVKQPQPLPEGVSNAAVGETLTPAPEPNELALVAWCALLLGLRYLRKLYRKPARVQVSGG
jgi:Ca-activated chloride channel family protein